MLQYDVRERVCVYGHLEQLEALQQQQLDSLVRQPEHSPHSIPDNHREFLQSLADVQPLTLDELVAVNASVGSTATPVNDEGHVLLLDGVLCYIASSDTR